VVARYQSEGNAGLSGFEQQLTDWRQWLAQYGRGTQQS